MNNYSLTIELKCLKSVAHLIANDFHNALMKDDCCIEGYNCETGSDGCFVDEDGSYLCEDIGMFVINGLKENCWHIYVNNKETCLKKNDIETILYNVIYKIKDRNIMFNKLFDVDKAELFSKIINPNYKGLQSDTDILECTLEYIVVTSVKII